MRIQIYIIGFLLLVTLTFSGLNLKLLKENVQVNLLVGHYEIAVIPLILGFVIVSWFLLFLICFVANLMDRQTYVKKIKDLQYNIKQRDEEIIQFKADAYEKDGTQLKELREYVLRNMESFRERLEAVEKKG